MLDLERTYFSEKCGICGVFGKNVEASRLVYFGLWALQHRGQESSGIASSDGKTLRLHKNEGLVAHVYNEDNLKKLKGPLAIGHNRYGTSGGTGAQHAQPIIKKGHHVALAHNGNLPSTKALEIFLNSKNISTEGFNDSEMMQCAVEYYYSHGNTIEQSVKKAFPLFTGAFCLLLLTKDKIVAVRDSNGIRPLSLGKLSKSGWVIASETCALDTIGATYVRDVKPGEMLVIDRNGLHSYQITKGLQKLDIFEFIYFARPDSMLLGKNVNSARIQLGVQLAKEYIVNADIIVPVPDSAIPAAVGYSQTTGIPLTMALVKNRYIHRTFIRPNQELRERDVMIKLNPLVSEIKGKEIAIIDDSIVRGTTSKKLISNLKRIGAKKVHFLVTSPPIRFPDFYGIDTPQQDKLIASHMSIEEIRKFIGADSLYYLSYEGMVKAINVPQHKLATHQFTGNYPIDLGDASKTINFSIIASKGKKQPLQNASVIGIGALNMDDFYQKDTYSSQNSKILPVLRQAGGAASNALCGLSRLGITTAALGTIGEDPDGMSLLKSLRQYQVDETFIITAKKPSGKSLVFVDSKSGKRDIYTHSGANDLLKYTDIPLDFIKKSQFLLMSTFIDEQQVALKKKLLEAVEKDVRSFLWLDDHALLYGDIYIQHLVKYADTVFVKPHTLERLSGYQGHQGAKKLLDLGCKTIVTLRSAHESEVVTKDGIVRIRSKSLPLKDETGISCGYVTGYLFGQLYGYSLKRSAFLGNIVASYVGQSLGCRSDFPTLSQLKKLDSKPDIIQA